jgi:MFS family permease
MSEEKLKPLPAAPIGITDPEQFAAAEERWAQCPLSQCKRNTNLLYEDFYLRDIRTNRLMCSGCAVRAEMGYMAREVIKKSDDRFFQGNQMHNLIVFGVMAGAAAISGLLSFMIGWFYFGFIVGGAIGGAAAALARRFTARKVTRQMHYFGGAGIILGSLLAMLLYSFYLGVPFEYIFSSNLINVGASAAGMFAAAWGVLMRRI